MRRRDLFAGIAALFVGGCAPAKPSVVRHPAQLEALLAYRAYRDVFATEDLRWKATERLIIGKFDHRAIFGTFGT